MITAMLVFACGDDDAAPASPIDGGSEAASDIDGATDAGASLPPGTTTLATGPGVNGIALSATHVYWTEGASGAGGAIRRVPLGGGAVEMLGTTTARPSGIAVDATHVYVATDAKNVVRVPIGGGAAEEIAKAIGTAPNPIVAVAVDANGLFWLEGGSVRRAQTDGGEPLLIGSTSQETGQGISLHDGDVWWTSYGANDASGRVASTKANADGGQPTIIYAQAEEQPWGITSGAGGTFWTSRAGGSIRTKAPTGSIVSLASGLATPSAIVLDGTTLWFTVRGPSPAVMKMPVAGGAPAVVVDATGKELADAIAVDATRVYWSGSGTLYATPK